MKPTSTHVTVEGKEVRRVPFYVTAFGAFSALIGYAIACFLLFGCTHSAYAFEVDGEYYPDSLSGKTVTFNSSLYGVNSFPSSLRNQWLAAPISTANCWKAQPYQTYYLYFETSAQSNNWWFAACTHQYVDTPPSSGPHGLAAYAYDSSAGAWWGIGATSSSHERPIVTFGNVPLNQTDHLFRNQTFIIWVVDNSDYRSRYSGAQWINPTVSPNYNAGTIGWAMDENNVTSSLEIQFSTTPENMNSWTTISTQNPSPYTGAWTCQNSGSYRLKWTYTLNNSTTSYTSSVYQISLNVPDDPGTNPPVFLDVIERLDDNTGYYTVYAVFDSPQPATVKLQIWNGSYWVDYASFAWSSINSNWTYSGHHVQDGDKRIFATADDGSTRWYNLSITTTTPSGDWLDVFGDVGSYVRNFLDNFGNFFGWLPDELRSFLYVSLMAMIILGVVQLVKP